MTSPLRLILTPTGTLRLETGLGTCAGDSKTGLLIGDDLSQLTAAFARGSMFGLVQLAAAHPTTAFASSTAYWRDFAKFHLTRQIAVGMGPLSEGDVNRWLDLAPPLPGGEYLAPAVIHSLWQSLGTAVDTLQTEQSLHLQQFLARQHPSWETLGRVCLSLAEQLPTAAQPFALLATYTTRLSLDAKPQHAPLGKVLAELTAKGQKEGVARIAATLQAAAIDSTFLREWLASRRLFSPQALTSTEARTLLRDVPQLERAGLRVRVPSWWNVQRPPRVRVEAEIGAAKPQGVGIGALMDFRLRIAMNGVALTDAEWADLRANADGLVLVRGQWVEVDLVRIESVLSSWRRLEQLVEEEGLSFAQALRLVHRLSGPPGTAPSADAAQGSDWSEVRAGAWLKENLAALRQMPPAVATPSLHATLRPYQAAGLSWLLQLNKLGLGGCLADDMGLGKTVQVLALFATLHDQRDHRETATAPRRKPHLLVVPATLVPNWQAEARKFTPDLCLFVAHPSALPSEQLRTLPAAVASADLVITTYGALLRYPWLLEHHWSIVVLDEAQAIKNPRARQTVAVKTLIAEQRLALTGTPVENRPLDLWSLFDFINPGLLGTASEFTAATTSDSDSDSASASSTEATVANPFAAVRSLLQPYLLRRLKSDRSIVPDLPDKTEIPVYCGLAPEQAALYARLVDELKLELKNTATLEDGKGKETQRRGAVLTTLMKLKQVCDHPALLTGDANFGAASSGKLQQLLVLARGIAERQEKMLVFTQFRVMTEVLQQQLTRLFGRPGCVLHGDTPVTQRQALVERFQSDDGPPFFILSVKAGGTGLTLTAASHVVHFDRWWNPAVEDQATDRAYRIGQKRNVLVHKFICAGTIEARIATLLASKKGLAQDLLSEGGGVDLAALADNDLLDLLRLDLSQSEMDQRGI